MSIEDQSTVGSKTPIDEGEGFVVSGRFRKARVKPIVEYGAYRGTGHLRVSSRGIEVHGRHVRTLAFRLIVGIALFGVPLVVTMGKFALGFIPIYLVLEYVLLEDGDNFLPWSAISRFTTDRRRLLVSIQSDGAGKYQDTIVLRTDAMDALLGVLRSYAPGVELGQVASHEDTHAPIPPQEVLPASSVADPSPLVESRVSADLPPPPHARASAPTKVRHRIRHGSLVLPALIAGLVLLAVFVTIGMLRGRPPADDNPPDRGASPSAVAPQAPVSLNVESEFPSSAQGRHFLLSVDPTSTSSDCVVNKLDGVMVYLSQCNSWRHSSLGYSNIYFFHLTLANNTASPVAFQLLNLAIVTSEGGQYQPVYVGTNAEKQQAFLPESATVLPHASISGWVTFDASLAFVPARISYLDNDHVVSVKFPCRTLLAAWCFDGS